ncbi:MAG: YggS family pyridoxal phosphate-dependent enzyme [Bacteroidales bacterium]|nr:YggS family pyridoxal phosphate-dependent enzyme [Bacteroidales bacterium]
MSIASQITSINNELPSTVKLVAVSKFKPVEAVMEAYGAGQRRFGENRPQELAAKAVVTPSDIEWHFIGHLQTNKVKMVVPYASMIESIHSRKLLEAVNNYAASMGKVMDCLLELHIATDEQTKQGFTAEEALALAADFNKYPYIRFRGVMGMASFTDDMDKVRSEFASLKAAFDAIVDYGRSAGRFWVASFDEISMGMSHDYKIAIEEGATIVRIGTTIFGAR